MVTKAAVKTLTENDQLQYVFPNPGRVKIRARTEDESPYADTSCPIWRWSDSGVNFEINWEALSLPSALKETAKAYIFHRLESRSPHTVNGDAIIFRHIANSDLAFDFPWSTTAALKILVTLYNRNVAAGIFFRVFYCWCLTTGKPGYSRETYFSLEETKLDQRSPYESIFLHQQYVTHEQEMAVLRLIEDSYEPDNWRALRDNALLHLSFELAPRPTQLFTLNAGDLEIIQTPTAEKKPADSDFYSVWLPMAKKLGSGIPERRPRRISAPLGRKIQELIQLNDRLFEKGASALFLNDSGKRLSANSISRQIINQIEFLDLPVKAGATLLRHHLGQGLADQGAPADVIAEALGHNSTVAARAYIAATPTIAKIKARALGKSTTYMSIMKMMLTGEIADKSSYPKERWVKGVVHIQYLTGIGGCDLPAKTLCPKNPIYSCYSCKDFHPFSDGPHREVRKELEKQAQVFIDVATESMDLDRSRVPIQLEQTMEAVDSVISRCQQQI
jgi:integrase